MTKKKSRRSAKERATDIPGWVKGEIPLPGESGKDFAKRLCDKKYREGNYPEGPGSEYSKIEKWLNRKGGWIMKENSTTYRVDDDEALYLVGFCLNSKDEEHPDVYTLITSGGEKDRPIVQHKKIIFFKTPELASSALSLADAALKRLGPAPQEVVLVCNPGEMLRLVEHECIDETAEIINCLNTFFDLVEAVRIPLSENYKRILYDFADHLTFHREFGTFLEERRIERSGLREAIEWLIDTVFSNSRVLSLQKVKDVRKRRKPKTSKKQSAPKVPV